MSTEIVIFGARLIRGNPLVPSQRTDDADQPKFKADGTADMETWFVMGVPKGPEAQHGADGWKHTEWGQKVVAEAQAAWPQGEWQIPSFSWKIEDGDSNIPNKNNKRNCEQEGYPGNWIIRCSSGWDFKVFDDTQPGGMVPMFDKNALKTGDYADFAFMCKSNSPSKTTGMYANQTNFAFTRAGQPISVSQGADAATLFGRPVKEVFAQPPAGPAPVPTAAPVAASIAPAPAPAAPVAPHNAFLQAPAPASAPAVPSRQLADGSVHTEATLALAGWTPEQIAAVAVAQ